MYGWSEQWKRERAETQMTLGKLITALEAMPKETQVANMRSAHSYRGYYSDLAFEREAGTRQAGELLTECRNAMGRVFQGYKGGDFVMGESTPIWIAEYGCGGDKLMDVHTDGTLDTAPDEF